MEYPELGTFNAWRQTNNPLDEADIGQTAVDGFEPIETHAPRYNWGGLLTQNIHTLLKGTPNTDNWFFAVGMYNAKWSISSGTYSSIPSNNEPTNSLYLWIKMKNRDISVSSKSMNLKILPFIFVIINHK